MSTIPVHPDFVEFDARWMKLSQMPKPISPVKFEKKNDFNVSTSKNVCNIFKNSLKDIAEN